MCESWSSNAVDITNYNAIYVEVINGNNQIEDSRVIYIKNGNEWYKAQYNFYIYKDSKFTWVGFKIDSDTQVSALTTSNFWMRVYGVK